MFDTDTQKQLSSILENMGSDVTIVLFKKPGDKSLETESFMKEFCAFSPKLDLKIYDIETDIENAKAWGALDAPLTFVTDSEMRKRGIGFYGTPGGYEINSFVTAILEMSGHGEALTSEQSMAVQAVSAPIVLYAYIALNCPQCPQAVMNIHKLAYANDNIKAYMVEGPAFKSYAEQFGVTAFPTIVVEGRPGQELIGENAKDLDKVIQLLK